VAGSVGVAPYEHMQTLAQIRTLLEERGLAPRKSLGQNFLIDQNLIRKLVDAAGVGAGDLVLEVGPGTGTLTEELLERGCEVVACELDRGLAELLRERLGPNSRFTLIEGDCLASKRELAPEIVARLGGRPFTLVANLPYGAATPLTTVLLTQFPKCRGVFVTVQKEVADRLLAGPASKDYGLVSVLAQALAEVKRIAALPPECFWPRPEVTSSMVAINRRERPLTDEPGRLAEVCQRVFATRRKQLASILGRDIPWPPGVSGTMRAEELTVEKLVELSKVVGSG
jgi:16S rRNA (adenine1518-N6/adenine1519-N6)-dimethyltransferase